MGVLEEEEGGWLVGGMYREEKENDVRAEEWGI
jgi:hypothetical protein